MRVVFYLVWAILLAVFQPTLGRWLAVGSIAPDFFLCFVIGIAVLRGAGEGATCGAIFGLIYDLLIGRRIGVNAMVYLYLGLAAGLLSPRFFGSGKSLLACLGTAVATVIAAAVYGLVLRATGADMKLSVAILRIGLPEAVYNAVVGFFMLYPMRKSMRWVKMKELS